MSSDRTIKYQLVGLVNDEIGYSSEVIDLEVQIKATLSSIYDVKVDTIVSVLNET